MPKVSVVIPTYNRAHLILETLDSVITQTYTDVEILVVDDGSTDNTASVIQGYSPKIQYLYRQNGGIGAARNTGILAAKGELIAFLDSDDLWLPEKIDKQVESLARKPKSGLVYCDTEIFNSDTRKAVDLVSRRIRPYDGWAWRHLIMGDFIASPSPLIRRSVFEKVGLFNFELKILRGREDWEMWLRIAARFPIEYIPEVLARYRIHSGNMTREEDLNLLHISNIEVIEQACVFAPEIYMNLRRKARSELMLRTGRAFAGRGEVDEAKNMFQNAVQTYPMQVQGYIFLLITLLGQRNLVAVRDLNRWLKRVLQITK